MGFSKKSVLVLIVVSLLLLTTFIFNSDIVSAEDGDPCMDFYYNGLVNKGFYWGEKTCFYQYGTECTRGGETTCCGPVVVEEEATASYCEYFTMEPICPGLGEGYPGGCGDGVKACPSGRVQEVGPNPSKPNESISQYKWYPLTFDPTNQTQRGVCVYEYAHCKDTQEKCSDIGGKDKCLLTRFAKYPGDLKDCFWNEEDKTCDDNYCSDYNGDRDKCLTKTNEYFEHKYDDGIVCTYNDETKICSYKPGRNPDNLDSVKFEALGTNIDISVVSKSAILNSCETGTIVCDADAPHNYLKHTSPDSAIPDRYELHGENTFDSEFKECVYIDEFCFNGSEDFNQSQILNASYCEKIANCTEGSPYIVYPEPYCTKLTKNETSGATLDFTDDLTEVDADLVLLTEFRGTLLSDMNSYGYKIINATDNVSVDKECTFEQGPPDQYSITNVGQTNPYFTNCSDIQKCYLDDYFCVGNLTYTTLDAYSVRTHFYDEVNNPDDDTECQSFVNGTCDGEIPPDYEFKEEGYDCSYLDGCYGEYWLDYSCTGSDPEILGFIPWDYYIIKEAYPDFCSNSIIGSEICFNGIDDDKDGTCDADGCYVEFTSIDSFGDEYSGANWLSADSDCTDYSWCDSPYKCGGGIPHLCTETTCSNCDGTNWYGEYLFGGVCRPCDIVDECSDYDTYRNACEVDSCGIGNCEFFGLDGAGYCSVDKESDNELCTATQCEGVDISNNVVCYDSTDIHEINSAFICNSGNWVLGEADTYGLCKTIDISGTGYYYTYNDGSAYGWRTVKDCTNAGQDGDCTGSECETNGIGFLPGCGDGNCYKNYLDIQWNVISYTSMETCISCEKDCGSCPTNCGNQICGSGEDEYNCPEDCKTFIEPDTCNDGTCSSFAGENYLNCPSDCKPLTCGTGGCEDGENCLNCYTDCGPCSVSTCGDGKCLSTDSETCDTCPTDCGGCPSVTCPDEYCDLNGGEGCFNCPQDCGLCSTVTQPPVVVVCGDDYCDHSFETCGTTDVSPECNSDCKSCDEECLDDVNICTINGECCNNNCATTSLNGTTVPGHCCATGYNWEPFIEGGACCDNSSGTPDCYSVSDDETGDFALLSLIDNSDLPKLNPIYNKFQNENINFNATHKYSNITALIGSTCTISTYEHTDLVMIDQGDGNYSINLSFSSNGTFEWNVTCNYPFDFSLQNNPITRRDSYTVLKNPTIDLTIKLDSDNQTPFLEWTDDFGGITNYTLFITDESCYLENATNEYPSRTIRINDIDKLNYSDTNYALNGTRYYRVMRNISGDLIYSTKTLGKHTYYLKGGSINTDALTRSNFISLAFNETYTAKSLLNEVPNSVRLITLERDSNESYSYYTSQKNTNHDYSLEIGESYSLEVNQDTNYTMLGSSICEALVVQYDLYGSVSTNDKYSKNWIGPVQIFKNTAEKILNSINGINLITKLLREESNSYESIEHQETSPNNNYSINIGEGYEVEVTEDVTFYNSK